MNETITENTPDEIPVMSGDSAEDFANYGDKSDVMAESLSEEDEAINEPI